MFAFLKCNQAWVETWFPDSGELEKLAETKPLADGEGYFLKYDSADGKRHPVTVSSHWDWADQSLPDLGAPWYAVWSASVRPVTLNIQVAESRSARCS